MAKKNKSSGSRIVFLIVVLLGLLALYKVFGPNTNGFPEGTYLYVHTGSDYATLKKALTDGGFISDMFSFDLVAKTRKLPAHVHPGKYKIEKGMSNFNIVRMLRNGRQTPVKLVIHKLRTKQDLVNIVCNNLEADSTSLKQMLHDPTYLSQFGLDTNTALCAILPDTYDFYWNSTADRAFKKIQKNYVRFWDETRKQEAKNLGLTPVKAMIVASIVDEETNMPGDKPKVASVYLNRLDKGMKLQADPTVRFALGDFTIKRVTGEMLQINSPYNTYLNEGLPPGPICTPAPSSIDAVLTAPRTTYLYFCAKEDFSGYSNFATTYDEQVKNAKAYQQALDARGIH
jgi:UPF0755 protein